MLGLIYPVLGQPATLVESGADIEVFMREELSAVGRQGLPSNLQQSSPPRMILHDVGVDPAALARLMELAEKHRVQALGVPAFTCVRN
jgi:hypothetical protein